MTTTKLRIIAFGCALVCASTLIYRGIHLLFPELWLPPTAEPFRQATGLRKVDPHIYDQEWFDAARAGRLDITKALLDAGFPPDSRTNSGYTALIMATYHGHHEEVSLLLHAGANPCLVDGNGNTALMGALFKGEMDVARLLLNTCPVDQANNNGQTALSFAALFGRYEIIPQLVDYGADPEHLDNQGNTALTIVQRQQNIEAATVLRRLGAKH
jgi:ankyrin repeat protein